MNKWKFDPTHCSVEFSVIHFGVSWVKGRFANLRGTIEFDPENPELSSVEAFIEVKSVWTGNESRDKHLMSSDFFDMENHPDIIFKSESVKKTEGDEYKIKGKLSMRGIEKEVVLSTKLVGVRDIPTEKGLEKRAGFVAHTKINRQDFKISWDAPAGEGVSVAGNEVEITLNIEAVKIN